MSENETQFLCVDLDGTLLRSDILFETFWAALAKDWTSLFGMTAAFSKGRASLKRFLSNQVSLDVSELPYDLEVIDYVKNWRAAGGKTVLVTASDDTIAKNIADQLGIFDEVYGSDGTLNLKGSNKQAFLQEKYGNAGFTYVGDSAADVAVWRHSDKAVTVNARSSVREAAEDVNSSTEHLVTKPASLKPYIKALRPHQWLKNTLVFVPMLAGHDFEVSTLLVSLMAFVCFNVIASSVYVTNDLLDLSADRVHPRKCKRPFAAGDASIIHGTFMIFVLLLIGGLLAVSVGWGFVGVMVAYYVLTTAYSLRLKREIVVDIYVLAGLYTTRIIAGGVATGIALSVWLLIFSMFFFLSLAAIKRQAELIDNQKRGKMSVSGRGYMVDDLRVISMIAVSAGYMSVLVLGLYLNSPEVVELYNQPEFLWGVCLILLYWITRIVMVAHRGAMHDDPVVYAAKDKVSLVCFGGILLCALLGAQL